MHAPEGLEAVRALFGSEADRYDERHYGSGHRTFIGDRQRLLERVLPTLGLPPASRVLDVACGPGYFLQTAVLAGANATGLDSSRDMLRTSATRLGHRARLVVGDAMRLPFDSASFDLVNCSGLIEYLPDPTPMLSEFHRVLRPNGQAMVSSTNRRSPALLLDPIIESLRHSDMFRRLMRNSGLPVDETSLRPRRFQMTFHTPRRLSLLLQDAGFDEPTIHYCHLQLLPHPIDHLVPIATTACVKVTDRLLSFRPLRAFAEGLLAVSTRSGDVLQAVAR